MFHWVEAFNMDGSRRENHFIIAHPSHLKRKTKTNNRGTSMLIPSPLGPETTTYESPYQHYDQHQDQRSTASPSASPPQSSISSTPTPTKPANQSSHQT
ncbi:hypothetical protein ONS95_005288 [Cadophora gregata]|uniref:uncharacterized protein n=1 Tax=Cadophora gregata TaxID=51156 RepID=UPI0026DBE423|nr:uncharacterized protein ONS95_005288 [Cadophora gregata]KAK0103254.1 hypothetical protein ONS95_005288 [Cadophora gregata]KAK0107445.1 hypothetical protein ONS96_003262 [Cadophora gregata f. sp. sojae]